MVSVLDELGVGDTRQETLGRRGRVGSSIMGLHGSMQVLIYTRIKKKNRGTIPE
jgi:hypothetical protein